MPLPSHATIRLYTLVSMKDIDGIFDHIPSVETLSKATSYLSTDMTCFTSLHPFMIYIYTAKLAMVRTLGKLSFDLSGV